MAKFETRHDNIVITLPNNHGYTQADIDCVVNNHPLVFRAVLKVKFVQVLLHSRIDTEAAVDLADKLCKQLSGKTHMVL